MDSHKPESMRNYDTPIPSDGFELFTIEEWMDCILMGFFNEYDGSAYWCKEGFYSREDSVFYSPALSATHVILFSA